MPGNMGWASAPSRTSWQKRGLDGGLKGLLVALGLSAVWAFSVSAAPGDASAAPAEEQGAEVFEIEPAILGAADADLYRKIFALQERARWEEADRLVGQLEKDILMGHVLFQRYMHPTGYRSSFKELRKWLSLYADHPGAERVYRLALKRQAKGVPRPTTPRKRAWREELDPEYSAFEIYNPPRSAAQRKRAKEIERYVQSLIRRERPTQALAYLKRDGIKGDLTRFEYDRIRQRIAASYFAEQKDGKAYELAAEIADRSHKAVPLADWTAGLAAWRQGHTAAATRHFERLAGADYIPDSLRAAAGFWASRGKLLSRKPQDYVRLLNEAADHPLTFYGILASHQLGHDLKLRFELPRLDGHSFSLLTADHGIARAVALAQVGKRILAEEEMRRAHGRLPAALDAAFISLADRLSLPHSELIGAMATEQPGLEAGLFPVPDYEPRGGYLVDRALIYAIARQESKFYPRALSRAGAHGLMQVRPITAIDVTGDRRYSSSFRDALFEPEINLSLGQRYVKKLLNTGEPRGNMFMLATAYNGGPGNLRRWMSQVKYNDDPLLFIESIPSPETRDYIEQVLTNLWIYRARLGQPAPTLKAVASGKWPVYQSVDELVSDSVAARR
ncbi:MAG: lytic transglycosylase domain-containing protein [Alphaproteobacteria bacterium]